MQTINMSAKRIAWAFEDKGEITFKSQAEYHRARILEVMRMGQIIQDWQYEPRTFLFHGDDIPKGLKGKSYGVRKYTPDFLVVDADGTEHWEEVKNNYITQKDHTKMKCMSQYHPDIKLWLVMYRRPKRGKTALRIDKLEPFVERIYEMKNDCKKLGLK